MSYCQLYSYNSKECDRVEEDENYFAEEQFLLSKLPKDHSYWLNFHRLTEKTVVRKFFDNQKFDRLALEDVYARLRRPKLEDYDGFLFFSIRSVLPPESNSSPLVQEQLSFVLGKNYLISLQEKRSDHFPEVRDRLELKKGKIRDRGADFLLFRLLDAIIDNYFEVVDHVGESARRLEPEIIHNNSNEVLKTVEIQKRRLNELRKTVIPMKEIAVQLVNSPNPILDKKNERYFDDLRENCMSVLDEIDSNLSMLDGLTNLHYAAQGQRMNEIMKVLTVISAIFIPLTFLAGIYGMNFQNMPELQLKNGYFVLLGVMAVIAMGLVVYFIRKGWLNR